MNPFQGMVSYLTAEKRQPSNMPRVFKVQKTLEYKPKGRVRDAIAMLYQHDDPLHSSDIANKLGIQPKDVSPLFATPERHGIVRRTRAGWEIAR